MLFARVARSDFLRECEPINCFNCRKRQWRRARRLGAHGYASLNAADACVEESLTGLPAFSTDVAWRSFVAHRLDRDRSTRRARRVRPLLVRRARSMAARC